MRFPSVLIITSRITWQATFQLAKNALAEEKPQEQILELLQDARAYAKINKIASCWKQFKH